MADKGMHHASLETGTAYGETDRKLGHDGLQLDERGHYDSSSNDVAAAEGLAALESEKTSWFGYMKTKDFWIVIVVGYVHSKSPSAQRLQNANMLFLQTNPGTLHHRHKHFLFPPCWQGYLDSSLPDHAKLRAFDYPLLAIYHLQVRSQEVLQDCVERWLEVYHSVILRRRG